MGIDKQQPTTDDLSRNVDVVMDQLRELLAVLLSRVTSMACAPTATFSHRLDALEHRIDAISTEQHIANLRHDQARAQIDAQEQRLTALEVGAPKVVER